MKAAALTSDSDSDSSQGRVHMFALQLLAVGAVGIALAYASAFGSPSVAASGPWLMAISLPILLIAVLSLGAVRRGKGLGVLLVPFMAILVFVAGGFLLALILPPDRGGDALWWGLPRRAAVVIYGVGLMPILVLPLVYALTFRSMTLSTEDLERVVAARRR